MESGSFRTTADDLIAANRLHWLQTFRLKRAILLLMAILAVSSLWLSWSHGWWGVVAALMLGPILAILYGALWLGSWLLVGLLARRRWRQSEPMWVDQQVTWTAEEIEFRSVRGEARFPWHDFYRWAADEKSILLYQSENAFYTLPLRGFTSEAAREIASLLTVANVPQR